MSTVPGSSRSAAFARADRWLGEEPFDNPAVVPATRVVITPSLQRVSRQDLRADNRNYNETSAFVDFAGAWVGFKAGAVGIAAYGHQPVSRLENFAFERGPNAVVPGVIQAEMRQREFRAGLAMSTPIGPVRFGLAGEFTGRSDVYDYKETSGSPQAGTRRLELDGSSFGGQAGLRWESTAPWGGALAVAAAGRWVPSLAMDVTQTLQLIVGDSLGTFEVEREAGWDAGVSASIPAGPTFRVIVAAGGRSAREWKGFDVTEGSGGEWKLGGEFHDERDPWTLRFGVGQEYQTDVPEPRAGVVGVGFSWDFEGLFLDVGVMRRTLMRADQPTSYEDRLLASAIVTF
jgi:hypothetical protein